MEITGIVWEDEDGCWCIEVDETEYKSIMGEENWAVEKALRNQFPTENLPWKITMSDLLMNHKVYSGNKVKLSIEIKKVRK
jgi:hypothetical protein